MFIVESYGKRNLETLRQLTARSNFWTIDCSLFSSAEWLLREVKSGNSLAALIQGLGTTEIQFPDEPLYCMSNQEETPLWLLAFENKEVDIIDIQREQKRVDIRWSKIE